MSKLNKTPKVPQLRSEDVCEAFEMVRATLTMLRQVFGIVFMAPQISLFEISDADMKQFALEFDNIVKVLRNVHTALSEKYQDMKSKES